MFHSREIDWSGYMNPTVENDTYLVVDSVRGERRLTLQSPIFFMVDPLLDQTALDIYSEETAPVDMECGETIEQCGVIPSEEGESTERRFFSTPCGQTYWVDEGYRLFTNKTVDIPIGFWCPSDQCIYLNNESPAMYSDDDDYYEDDSEDEQYTPPPTPPPMYEEASSETPLPNIHVPECNGDNTVIH
tara:strand:+ start:2586 stop:3149 length:564 start_codon:yes stop_codon:yes gene_type:complete